MYLEQRIQNYVEQFFQKSGMTKFPTVRQVAKGLNIGMKKIHDTVEGDYRCDLQGYNFKLHYTELEVYTDYPD